jgi:phosphoglycolate phosphatase-like HAD superfamily hydrolase
MRAIGVLTGLADRATLSQVADVVLDSIAELPAWLDHVPG